MIKFNELLPRRQSGHLTGQRSPATATATENKEENGKIIKIIKPPTATTTTPARHEGLTKLDNLMLFKKTTSDFLCRLINTSADGAGGSGTSAVGAIKGACHNELL